ncbi:MAG TPA: hypothetical protein VEA36_00520 [Candidatus Paceibacterota bacterium]|nr:hypothetical protein [Candidatus Paceibacterota bacterium]
MSVLTRLLDLLFPPRESATLVAGATINDLHRRYAPGTYVVDGARIMYLLPYRDPLVRACVVEAKFHGNTRAQGLLGRMLEDYAGTTDAVLVPIPLSARRLRARGYNQVEEIAKARCAGRVDTTVLQRTRDTRAQTAAQEREERLRNLTGAFSATVDPAKRYLVVDDVATTGATLSDAHRALREAGAKYIELLAIAH